ncbi:MULTISPECIES: LysR family transcriptional regulator [Arthrobacter]|uniref:LysR family transcriptional regulator n=1 Tax=Arthrobacter terricola TaxID=2547396 RepID=A0A4V2ZRT2_9MICC|nr:MULTISPECIES: LysR family transcriptional regulator [Arthrobacter]MBT8163501.1 LysR family transcriptional regulator [Arthrobacter sp. GN70]TDF89454.1 LysR family transcriptional regulator [Arthrobacter terricola]
MLELEKEQYMLTIQDELARVFAGRELNRLDQLRACASARSKGLKQAEIARRLSISQPEVHRILRRIKNFPELLERTPREVILDFHVGLIDHEHMLQELTVWPYTYSADAEPGNPEGQITGGSWDEISDAFHRDLITGEDYEAIVRAVHPSEI